MDPKIGKNVIVVDDDRSIRVVISTALTRAGYNVKSSGTAAGMWRLVESDFADILITDVGLPDGDALDILPKFQTMKPNLKIIVMSARSTLLTAVRAEKKGAFEYLPKPFDLEELLNLVSNTFNTDKINKIDNIEGSTPKSIYDSGPVIGKSIAMQEIYKTISRVVNTDHIILVSGESGTGKNLICKSVHDLSSNNDRPFINLGMEFFDNLSNEQFLDKLNNYLPIKIDNLNNIYGCSFYVKNVSEFSLSQQKNVLNFIENTLNNFFRSEDNIKIPRLFFSSKPNIYDLVNKGLFREDLFYRINAVPIKLPSLKDRFEDISDLANLFLNNHFKQKGSKRSISYEGINILKNYSWPGNIRELKNVIERICLLSSVESIDPIIIEEVLSEDRVLDDNKQQENLEFFFNNYLKRFFRDFDENSALNNLHQQFISKIEKPLIETTLKLFRGNQIKASKSLGFNRNTLRSKINFYGIEVIKKRKV